MEHNNKVITQELRQAVIDIKTAILQSQARAAKMISGSQLSLYYGVGLYVSANSREGNGELEPSSLLVINYVESYLVYVASLKKASRRCVHLRNSGLSI